MHARKASASPVSALCTMPPHVCQHFSSNRKHVPDHHDLVVAHGVDHHVQREAVLARSCVSYPLSSPLALGRVSSAHTLCPTRLILTHNSPPASNRRPPHVNAQPQQAIPVSKISSTLTDGATLPLLPFRPHPPARLRHPHLPTVVRRAVVAAGAQSSDTLSWTARTRSKSLAQTRGSESCA